jgi:hypothetical protein
MNVVGNRFWFHRIWDWGTKVAPFKTQHDRNGIQLF